MRKMLVVLCERGDFIVANILLYFKLYNYYKNKLAFSFTIFSCYNE